MGLKDLFPESGVPSPVDGDRMILDQLRELGADLSRPRHVMQFLYFPSDAAARRAAATLGAGGYQVEVRPPVEGFEEWVAVAETHVVVDAAWVDEMRPQLEAIALEGGGTYDGWEAAAD
jgi:hypothetical protein